MSRRRPLVIGMWWKDARSWNTKKLASRIVVCVALGRILRLTEFLALVWCRKWLFLIWLEFRQLCPLDSFLLRLATCV